MNFDLTGTYSPWGSKWSDVPWMITLFSHKCLLTGRSCKYLTTLTNANESSSDVDSLIWPIAAEHSCQRWKDSGEPPFPFLQLPTSPSWHRFPLSDLRHMHHLALLASVLELSKTRQFCLWWSEFSMYVNTSNRRYQISLLIYARSGFSSLH